MLRVFHGERIKTVRDTISGQHGRTAGALHARLGIRKDLGDDRVSRFAGKVDRHGFRMFQQMFLERRVNDVSVVTVAEKCFADKCGFLQRIKHETFSSSSVTVYTSIEILCA